MKKLKIVFILILLSGSISLRVSAKSANDLNLIDNHGKKVSFSDFKGKVIVMDFWFTGCINCMNFYKTSLLNAERHYMHNTDVIFISICIDKDKVNWLNSLEKGRYASKESINLYTGGLGASHDIIKKYKVTSYPQPIILGKKGEVLDSSIKLIEPGELLKSITKALK